jgi:hypothetical protein
MPAAAPSYVLTCCPHSPSGWASPFSTGTPGNGGNGAQGLIVITYTPNPAVKTALLTATGAGTFLVPDDWNNSANMVEAISGGGGGAGSGAGGMYARGVNLALTPGSVISYSIGSGGQAGPSNSGSPGQNGGDTSFGSYVLAKGGPGGPVSTSANPAASPSLGVGSVMYQGGSGGGATCYSGNVTGFGGGGAAGPGGAGGAGGSGANGNTGGAGDNGPVAGGGGAANGTNGTEWGSAGSGGGGGGSWNATCTNGGNGGNYGAGGGGNVQCGNNVSSAGGSGAQGLIVIRYIPVTAPASATLSNLLAGNNRSNLPASNTVGATASEFGVSSSGAATYSTPIIVPIGTTGVQPKITIDYATGGGKGPLGYGGSIGGLSVISRCGSDLYHDSVIQPINLTASDKFCLNGERLVPVNGAYGAVGTEYRTSLEEFSRVISYGSAGSGPAYFKVWKKSGEILEYGNTADSFIGALGRAEARAWALNKLSDTAGNYIKYSYFQNSTTGEYGISRIDFTGNDGQGLAPYNSVQFVYATAPISTTGYFAGQQYTQTQRLTDVKVYADSTLYRDYQLNYLSPNQLASIVECTASACFEPTLFTWAAPEITSSTTGQETTTPVPSFTNQSGGLTGAYSGYVVAASGDFNGDGITDFLLMPADTNGRMLSGSSSHVFVWLGGASGFTIVDLGANAIPANYKVVATGNFGSKRHTDLYLMSVDQNGRNAGSASSPDYVWLSNGDGTFMQQAVPAGGGV